MGQRDGGGVNKAAQALGRLARGVPKKFSAAEIARRSKILAEVNARKRAAAKKRRMPNEKLTDGGTQAHDLGSSAKPPFGPASG